MRMSKSLFLVAAMVPALATGCTTELVKIPSRELQARTLDSAIQHSVAAIRSEFEQGADVTHRLTRQFYKAGFNDFLFNTFGIHHIHLGQPGVALDKTKQHIMSGGVHDASLRFACTTRRLLP